MPLRSIFIGILAVFFSIGVFGAGGPSDTGLDSISTNPMPTSGGFGNLPVQPDQSNLSIRPQGEGIVQSCDNLGGTQVSDAGCNDVKKPPEKPICETNPSDPSCAQAEEKKDPQRQEPSGPPPCVAETQRAAAQCGAQHGSAQNSCSSSRLTGAQQEAQQNASQLQGQQNANNSCHQENASQRQTAQAISSFASSCGNAVQQCANACQEMQRIANACRDARASQIASRYQAQGQDCSGGSLAARPAEARQQAQAMEQTAQANAQVCDTSSASTQKSGSGSGPLAQENGNSSGGSGNSGGFPGGNPDVSGVVPVSTVDGGSRSPASIDSPRTGSGGSNGGDAIDVTGAIPESHVGAYDTGGSLNSLAALPTRAATASENLEEASKDGNSKAGTGASGTYGGGRGRRVMLRPVGRGSAAGFSMGDEKELGLSASGTTDAFPNLDQFRPRMGGLQASCPPGTFNNAENPRECLHKGNRNIFDAMTEAFNRKRQIPGDLINDESQTP